MCEVVSREINKKLPTAGYPSVRLNVFWINCTIKRLKGLPAFKARFYLNTRVANATSIQLGPLDISIPRRWLKLAAEVHHPEVFK